MKKRQPRFFGGERTLSLPMRSPDDNVPAIFQAILAAELQRGRSDSIVPQLLRWYASSKRAAEGDLEDQQGARH